MELLVFAVAKDEPALRVPQNEGFGYVLDGIGQSDFGILVELIEGLLPGNIKDNADKVNATLRVSRGECGARPEPDKMSVGMAHAEFMVEAFGAVLHQVLHKAVKWRVIAMHEGRDIGGCQALVAG